MSQTRLQRIFIPQRTTDPHVAPQRPKAAEASARDNRSGVDEIPVYESPAAAASKPAKAKRLIPPKQFPNVKADIDGKDLTKIGRVGASKRVFLKLPKNTITLSVA
ncbi:hypothetical protein SNOG_16340 [Parastagonospora nodorum SN15]|uniref:Uncharacterized protein n=1 Tax=Phaeosphaeria nodorum (strain SN15 / ATCC MYA-4574 / FGSC 10173) TaxID=321614 RepID=Q0TW20_PHANO|nr:hypothetical protein SNOG_16340 [Parastagonospora nodorum SN15]EAT76326.2 hypothetical protein SNOG_16340 [Parastagonospora nodorum SN15]